MSTKGESHLVACVAGQLRPHHRAVCVGLAGIAGLAVLDDGLDRAAVHQERLEQHEPGDLGDRALRRVGTGTGLDGGATVESTVPGLICKGAGGDRRDTRACMHERVSPAVRRSGPAAVGTAVHMFGREKSRRYMTMTRWAAGERRAREMGCG